MYHDNLLAEAKHLLFSRIFLVKTFKFLTNILGNIVVFFAKQVSRKRLLQFIQCSFMHFIHSFNQGNTIVVRSEAATGGVLYKNLPLKISQNSKENTCAGVSFLIKLQAKACNIIQKRDSDISCFPVNFAKFLRTPFFIGHLWWLLLQGLKKIFSKEK